MAIKGDVIEGTMDIVEGQNENQNKLTAGKLLFKNMRDDYNLAPVLAEYGIDASNKLFDNRYSICGIMGKGERGFVVAAVDNVVSHDFCALKIIFPYISERPHLQERIVRVVDLSRSLNHKNIVGIREVGRDENNLLYYVMDLVDGWSLERILHDERYNELSFPQVLYILSEIASALVYAHRVAGIIHRDVNPSNILIDDDGHVMLTDFSLAKELEEKNGLSDTGEVVGRLNYMSPRIFRGMKDYDISCDIYSFGILAYELCTGSCPFQIPDWTAIARENNECKLPKFYGKAKHYPAWFHTFIERCISQDEKHRFFAAEQLVFFLNDYIKSLDPSVFELVGTEIRREVLREMTRVGSLEKPRVA
ncbi:MAG: serine/threonine protein kinase [Deltaproteobacteria bacterium]|nr:serine/threonine protein kinase [Deltaproteobacteria bacterium]